MANSNIPTKGTTRRDFLKGSTVAASAAVAGALGINRSVPSTLLRAGFAAGSNIIRVGMIGCGGRNAGAAAQALAADSGARLVAMCDIFMDRVKEKRTALKGQKPEQVVVDDDHCFVGFDGYKHVIESSDVVVIANAAKFHPLHAMAAISAGKHVFVEKPHGIDPAGVKLLQRAAELAKEKRLCSCLRPAEPLSHRIRRNSPADIRWRHRRCGSHRRELPPRPVRHHRA